METEITKSKISKELRERASWAIGNKNLEATLIRGSNAIDELNQRLIDQTASGMERNGCRGSCKIHIPQQEEIIMSAELLEWLQEKLAQAEKSLRAREQMEKSWKSGTDEEWTAAAKMHPSTAKEPVMNKAARLKESQSQGRIAATCRRDVAMYKLAIEAVKNQNTK